MNTVHSTVAVPGCSAIIRIHGCQRQAGKYGPSSDHGFSSPPTDWNGNVQPIHWIWGSAKDVPKIPVAAIPSCTRAAC